MPHIVCMMNVQGDQATFTWSEGPASFEPYVMDGLVYKEFKEIAEEARTKLADLIKDYLYDPTNVGEAEFELAEAGHALYDAMFDPGAEQLRQARSIRKWLDRLSHEGQVETLEIVVESPWLMPWNVIYDQEPDRDEFLSPENESERWRPFWGLKYSLCGGRKVDPLRRMPILRQPKVLIVVDPDVRNRLPEDQQQRLEEFCQQRQLPMIGTQDELKAATKKSRPDLLYWLSHADPDALILSGDPISPRKLRRLLKSDDDEFDFGGLAFLNACQTAEGAGDEGSFFEAFHSVGFAGMIGTEHQTIDQFANPLGLDFLEAFLDQGKPVGEILQNLRGRVPLGLLYGTYCPPGIRVETQQVSPKGIEINRLSQVEGVALGSGNQRKLSSLPLPDQPYRSLASYHREDRALFAGRDLDIQRFDLLLDEPSTRLLVLHGESGVGKSSFLRAGVIPSLEDDECLGYRFLTARDGEESGQSSVLFIRATADLIGQLAEALCRFCAQPFAYRTPAGDEVRVDLPRLLANAVGASPNPAGVSQALREEPALLGRALAALSDPLPFSLVVLIDQGEEMFTLARSREEIESSDLALRMLRQAVSTSGNFKLILTIRTEYYGRFIDRLRHGRSDTGAIRDYLLTDFDEAALAQAIQLPTCESSIPHAAEVPYQKYGFAFADGMAEEIAARVLRYSHDQHDSVLPLVQVICSQLYDRVCDRPDKTIGFEDFEAIGGVEGGMRTHVERILGKLVSAHPTDKDHVKRLFTQLYNRQSDDSVTTALLPLDTVAAQWRGRTPLPQLLTAAEQSRLLRVSTFHSGDAEERRVSLGHDSLAKFAAQWDEELGRNARRRKAIALFSGALTVAVVMGVLATVAAVMTLRANKYLDAALDGIERHYAVSSKIKNQPGMRQVQKQLSDNAVADYKLISEWIGARNGELAKVHYDAGQTLFHGGRHKEAITYFNQVGAELGNHGDSSNIGLIARAENAKGRIYHTEDPLKARDFYENALALRQELVSEREDDSEYQANALRELANTTMNLGLLDFAAEPPDLVSARQRLEQAREFLIDAREKVSEDNTSLMREVDRDLGKIYLNLGKLAVEGESSEAAIEFDKAIGILERIRPPDTEIIDLLVTAVRKRANEEEPDSSQRVPMLERALQSNEILLTFDSSNVKRKAEGAAIRRALWIHTQDPQHLQQACSEFKSLFEDDRSELLQPADAYNYALALVDSADLNRKKTDAALMQLEKSVALLDDLHSKPGNLRKDDIQDVRVLAEGLRSELSTLESAHAAMSQANNSVEREDPNSALPHAEKAVKLLKEYGGRDDSHFLGRVFLAEAQRELAWIHSCLNQPERASSHFLTAFETLADTETKTIEERMRLAEEFGLLSKYCLQAGDQKGARAAAAAGSECFQLAVAEELLFHSTFVHDQFGAPLSKHVDYLWAISDSLVESDRHQDAQKQLAVTVGFLDWLAKARPDNQDFAGVLEQARSELKRLSEHPDAVSASSHANE